MKLIHTVVSAVGFNNRFEDPTFNRKRMRLLERLVNLASKEGAKLLVIPAGFLIAKFDKDVNKKVKDVKSLSQSKGIAIIGGVDIGNALSKNSKKRKRGKAAGPLPYWGFAVGCDVHIPNGSNHLWRQTSTSSTDWQCVPKADIPGSNRIIRVGDHKVAVLICGEVFSPCAKKRILKEEPQLIVNIAHKSMRGRAIQSMENFAHRAECPVALSQHIMDLKRGLHFWDAHGNGASQPSSHDFVNDYPPQAAWAVRLINLLS